MTTKTYILMNKNREILSFALDNETKYITHINDIRDIRYAPLGILNHKNEVERNRLNVWWEERAIPATRDGWQKQRLTHQLPNAKTLLEKSNALSLSDCYWINDPKNPKRWEDINFFTNPFSGDLGVLTIGEQSHSKNHDFFSPNASLTGDLEKKWVCDGEKRLLLKAGRGLSNQEVYNEVIASVLYKRLLPKDQFVPYRLVKENSKTYCCCENMLQENEEFIPVFDLLQKEQRPNDQSLYRFLKATLQKTELPHVETYLTNLFLSDAILANTDRHTRNFGVMRNVETLKFTRFAPIFDSGASLWCDKEMLEYPQDYEFQMKPWGKENTKLLPLFTSINAFDIKALNGFEEEAREILEKNPNLSPKRIDQIQFGLKNQIKQVKNHVKHCQRQQHINCLINTLEKEEKTEEKTL